ncbi:MAG: hypothetical protein COB62_01390 [Piscirickettsiaceae bacterium]|nr:MAG: hypothetical protein COB62_01390 [Piscirickettsiaceae bacterium]
MDVQLSLNLPSAGSDNLVSNGSIGSTSKSRSDNFSDHLDKKIDHLEKQHKNTTKSADSTGKANKNQKVNGSSSLTKDDSLSEPVKDKIDSHSLVKADSPDAKTPDVEDGVTAAKVVVDLHDESFNDKVGISLSTGDSLPLGNSLPFITSLNDGLQQSLTNDIVFDPLADAGDVVLPVSALSINLPVDSKPTVKGKSFTVAYNDVTNSSIQSNALEVVKSSDKLFDGFSLKNLLTTANGADSRGGQDNLTPLTIVNGLTTNQPSSIVTDKPLLTVDTPMTSPRWANDFNQHVQWMVNKSMTAAQIRLNPQQLGPIEVRVHMNNDQATISFTAQHGATREAIDAALPRLREMLSEQQVGLVDVNVSQHSFAEQHQQQLSDGADGGLTGNINDASTDDDELALNAGFDGMQVVYEGLFNKYA